MKKTLSLLISLVLVCCICILASSCENSNSRNSLFTDKFFEGATEIYFPRDGIERYTGDSMQALADVLRSIELMPVDGDIFLEEKESLRTPKPLNELKAGYSPYSECHITYDDGHTVVFIYSEDKLQLFADTNVLSSSKSFAVSDGNLRTRMMAEREIDTID